MEKKDIGKREIDNDIGYFVNALKNLSLKFTEMKLFLLYSTFYNYNKILIICNIF